MDTIGFTCPHCGHEFHPRIAELKLASVTACPSCNGPIEYDPGTIEAAAKQVEKALEKTLKDFSRGSKIFKLKK